MRNVVTHRTTRTRRRVLTLLAGLLTSITLLAATTPAQAAEYYRYWVYFHVQDGSYVSSAEGVGTAVPADGAVEAFRFAAPKDFKKPNLPRIDLQQASFEKVCGDEQAGEGEKRVAVLADFGVAADADGAEVPEPLAGCAVVPEKATGLQVLQSVAEVRTEKSAAGPILCAIEGYPGSGCADTAVQTATPADRGNVEVDLSAGSSESSDSSESSGTSSYLYVGLGGLLLLLAIGGMVLGRRRPQ